MRLIQFATILTLFLGSIASIHAGGKDSNLSGLDHPVFSGIGSELDYSPKLDGHPAWYNKYSYCNGDPVNRWDPTGLYWQVYVDPTFGKFRNEDNTLSANWIEDGTEMPEGGPSASDWQMASGLFGQSGTAYPQSLGQGESWLGTPPLQDLIPNYIVGPSLNKNPIWNGGFGSDSGRWSLPSSFGMRYEGGRYLASYVQNGPRSFDFTNAQEAGLEHYIFLRLENASRNYDLSFDLAAGTYSLGGIGDMAMLAGLSQWMMETEAGQAVALKYGSIGIGGGTIAYATFKKFKASKLADKMLPMMNLAREKMHRLMNSRTLSDAGITSGESVTRRAAERRALSVLQSQNSLINGFIPGTLSGVPLQALEELAKSNGIRIIYGAGGTRSSATASRMRFSFPRESAEKGVFLEELQHALDLQAGRLNLTAAGNMFSSVPPQFSRLHPTATIADYQNFRLHIGTFRRLAANSAFPLSDLERNGIHTWLDNVINAIHAPVR